MIGDLSTTEFIFLGFVGYMIASMWKNARDNEVKLHDSREEQRIEQTILNRRQQWLDAREQRLNEREKNWNDHVETMLDKHRSTTEKQQRIAEMRREIEQRGKDS